MYDAIGKGFDASKGEILAYLNADDMYEPGGLLRIGAWFRDHPDADVAYHENTVASNGWRFANVAQPSVGMYDLLKGHILFQDGVFFRRKAYTAIGGVNRALRRAGDYALWLEMSLWFKFHRVSGHVSSFRVRSGQISENMEAYELEQVTALDSFSKHVTTKRALWRLPGRIGNGVLNFIESKFRTREFFYPVDFPNMPPPPCDEPSLRAPLPVCPLSGAPPDRLLLSARHPMLQELDMQRMYLCESSRVAINHPAPSGVQWKRLRSNRFAVPSVDWSNPPAGVAAPSAPYASPYAKSKMGGTACERVLRSAACKVLRPNNDFLSATAAVHRNAVAMLTQLFDANDTRVRFLDVAALDGGMLDVVASKTKWQRAGVESDPALAAVARNRGHTIVECSEAEAACVLPADEQFHIVHLGALLPYLANPIKTVNALKNLLTPGGVLVMGSPNLDSKQQEWFGPAWAHWHLTRWHALYSRRAFEELARLASMDIILSGSFSHAEWTAFGMHFQAHGLAWSVPEISAIPESAFQHAGRVLRFVSSPWDYSGRGDWITAVLKSK